MEEGRDLRKVNRIERPKLDDEEIGKLGNCDRPLTKNEWGEMIIETQWAKLEAMGFLKGENPT